MTTISKGAYFVIQGLILGLKGAELSPFRGLIFSPCKLIARLQLTKKQTTACAKGKLA